MNEGRAHPAPARAGHSAPSTTCTESLGSSGDGGAAVVPAPSFRCQEQQALATGWHRGNVQFKAAWIFAAVVLAAVFTENAQRKPGASPCKGLGRLQAAALERGRGLWVAFFSYKSGNCVINSSVSSNHVLVSNALTGANLNVFHLKSKPKKSL